MNKTETLDALPEGIARAAQILGAQGLVAFPTETVYGLGGDARSDLAVARIFDAKARPRFNPLIVHVPDLNAARAFALFDAQAEAVAAAFWPGPLTLVLPLRVDAGLSPLVTADLDSVAIRVPAHPVAQALLRAFGGPLAAPSANPSGRVSPTRAAHVLEGLTGRIAAVLDGGACAVGVESTILGLLGAPALLRPGGVSLERLEALLGPLAMSGNPERPNAPGQLESHYAPAASVRLNAETANPGEVRLGFGAGVADLNLSPSADLIEAAANLFHMLREADHLAGQGGRISIAAIPENGLGRAINDRLRRAAAPRGLIHAG
ncbi:L-threonylcarbamoyladenylate synthase [Cypionkella sp.]|uniref:L-threonylcarbamoyladenylate synthase n=1 Tax=Cypionkella sp. TaxID=2811411 RepID=UPI002612ECC3|nr:L-threonylcarbamoyladenylate synthase [Cypionkella sp.]MDB5665335.1 translation factor [Cypionkella sp.]